MDPLLLATVIIGVAVLLTSYLSYRFKQPYVVGYILAGLVIGPFGLKLITNEGIVAQIGNLGIILLLFFVGMDIRIDRLLANWRVLILGTLLQALVTVALTVALGALLGLGVLASVVIAFAVVMSSTAIVLKVLEQWGERETVLGENAIGISIVHDLLAIPFLIILQLFGSSATSPSAIGFQALAGGLLIGLFVYLVRQRTFRLPRVDSPELEVFLAISLCFGLAAFAASFGLSPAFGSFVAGLIVAFTRRAENMRAHLNAFTIVFLALFFVSVGMLLDTSFVLDHLPLLLAALLLVFLVNTATMTLTLVLLKNPWRESMHAAAVLSHIGEFGFVIILVGAQAGIVSLTVEKGMVAIIILSLLFSPIWMLIMKHYMHVNAQRIDWLHEQYLLVQRRIDHDLRGRTTSIGKRLQSRAKIIEKHLREHQQPLRAFDLRSRR